MIEVLEDHRLRADAIRRGLPAAPPASRNPQSAIRNPRPTYLPCPDTDPWWQHLIKSGLSMTRVMLSPSVDDATFAARMISCGCCPHSELVGERLFCRCCGCPDWSASALDVKNAHELHVCPRKPPAW